MDEKVIFTTGTKIGILQQSSVTYLDSQYLTNYQKTCRQIKDRHAWKTEGAGARFMGARNPMQGFDEESTYASVNGVAFINDGDQIVYSISVDQFSGLFQKNPTENEASEGHIIHNTRIGFYNLDYNLTTNELAVSMHTDSAERNIGVVNITNGHYRLLTEGEVIDENPVWGRVNSKTIYYDSAGIGRNRQGMVIGFDARVINRLDLSTGDLTEIIAHPKYDYFMPKEDSKGNLYFLKKPVFRPGRKFTSPLEILLIPFKLVKAIVNWLELFTMRYTGETFRAGGPNPAKSKENDPKQVFINGNLINVEKTLKENKDKGEKFPGIAPRSWELMKMDKNGEIISVKKGVLDYDLNSRDEIIYSNGKHLVKLAMDDREELLEKVELATKIKVYR